MRKCVKCNEEKDIEQFRKRVIWYSHTCKKCYAAQYRTGKENTGRFKKGHIPWIKGKKGVKPRLEPKYKKKGRLPLSENRLGLKAAMWSLSVKERDSYTCKKCGSNKDLHAHHILPWKKDESKRFNIENGITLCRSCHTKTERKENFWNTKKVKI